MGQHWSGSYSGSTHSVWGQAATVHRTSPLGSHRHFSHGDTWTVQKKILTHSPIYQTANTESPSNYLALFVSPHLEDWEVKHYKCIREKKFFMKQEKGNELHTSRSMPSCLFMNSALTIDGHIITHQTTITQTTLMHWGPIMTPMSDNCTVAELSM